MIKVLQIVGLPMAAIKFVTPLAKELRKKGYRVDFASPKGEYYDKLSNDFETYSFCMKRKLISFSHILTFMQILKILKIGKYDIIHTHTPIASVFARLAASVISNSIVIYHVGTNFNENFTKPIQFIYFLIEKILGKCTNYIFTLNNEDLNYFVNRDISKKENTLCLGVGGSGVDLAKFNPKKYTQKEKGEMRLKNNISLSSYVIGYVGRVVKEKGIIELCVAFKDLVLGSKDVHLIIAGGTLSSDRDKDTLCWVKEFVKDNDIENKVTLMGFYNDVPKIMSIMDIFVLPSHREGFGLVIAEAAAMCVPSVAASTRGTREAIVNDETGLLFDVGNKKQLTEILVKLIADPVLLKRLRRGAYKRAIKKFDQRKIIKKQLDIYGKIAKQVCDGKD